MTSDDYLAASARTAGAPLRPFMVSPLTTYHHLLEATRVVGKIDQIKKALFYGKPTTSVRHAADHVPFAFIKADDDMLHAILGMMTESAELGELLADSLLPSQEKPLGVRERGRIIDELGDLLWYVALALRELEVSFEDVMAANIAKLQVRFPDKFDARLAIHRDDAAEGAVFG